MAATPDVELDVLAHLATLLPATVITATGATRNALAGPMRPVDQVASPAVFVHAPGGVMDFHNDGPLRRFDVQVMVRGGRRAYEAARVLAYAIYDALRQTGRFTSNAHVYTECRAVEACPTYLGQDENDAELLVMNFSVWYDG